MGSYWGGIAMYLKRMTSNLLIKEQCEKLQQDYDLLLKRLINNLQKNQKNQLWGWWPESVGSYWISLHVLEALLDAEKDGYKLSLDRQPIIDLLAYNFETRSQSDQIRILKILNLLVRRLRLVVI